MALQIDWAAKAITVPQADLTFVSGTLYEHDTNAFRLELRSREDDADGMAHIRTHRHNTEVTIASIPYARTIEIINGYTVEYEDGAYSVLLTGSNNNIWDIQGGVLVQNQRRHLMSNLAIERCCSGRRNPDPAEVRLNGSSDTPAAPCARAR